MTERTYTEQEHLAALAAARIGAATRALEMADVGCFGHHEKNCKDCAAWDWTRAGAGTPADAQKALAEHDAALVNSIWKAAIALVNRKPIDDPVIASNHLTSELSAALHLRSISDCMKGQEDAGICDGDAEITKLEAENAELREALRNMIALLESTKRRGDYNTENMRKGGTLGPYAIATEDEIRKLSKARALLAKSGAPK